MNDTRPSASEKPASVINPTMLERPLADVASDPDALSRPSADTSPTESAILASMIAKNHPKRVKALRYSLAALFVLAFGGSGFAALRGSSAQSTQGAQSGDFSISTIPLQSLKLDKAPLTAAPKLVVNGALQVGDSLIIQPTAAPQTALPGQLYFDKTNKVMRYYNGQAFVSLGGGGVTNNITNLGDNISNVNTINNVTNIFNSGNTGIALPDTVLLQAAAPGTQQAGNFNITGSGQVGTLKTTVIDSGGATLSINPAGGDINLAASSSLRFGGQQILAVNGSGATTSIRNTTSGGTVATQADNFAVSDAAGSHQSLAIDSNGAATFSNKTNSTTGFRVQNATGTNLITADTLNGNVAVSGAGTGNVSVATAAGNGVTGNISLRTGDSSTTAAGDVTIDAGNGIIDGTVVGTKTFEAGTDNMVNWFNASVAQSSAQAHSGSSSLAMTAGSAFWGIEENINNSITPVVPGHQYHFSLWARAATAGRQILSKAVWNGGAGGNVSLQTITDSATGWTEITGNGQAPAGATGVYLQINSSTSATNDVHYFDDITYTDLSSATAASKINIGATNAKFVTIGNINQIGETAIYGGSGINMYAGVSSVNLNGGVLSLTGGAASNFTTTAGALTLNGATGLTLMANSTTIASLTTTNFTINRNLVLANSHFTSTQTTAPTIGTPASCGTTPVATVTAGSTDSAGSFTITTGTGGTSATCDTVITFNQAYGAAPKSIIVIGKTNAASAARQMYVSASTTTNFTVSFGQSAAGANSTTYSFSYWVIE